MPTNKTKSTNANEFIGMITSRRTVDENGKDIYKNYVPINNQWYCLGEWRGGVYQNSYRVISPDNPTRIDDEVFAIECITKDKIDKKLDMYEVIGYRIQEKKDMGWLKW